MFNLDTKWRYINRALKEKAKSSSSFTDIPIFQLPIWHYGWALGVNGTGKGRRPGTGEDEFSLSNEKYAIELFSLGCRVPILGYNVVEYDIRKEGKSKVGRMSQLDIERTLRKKMERLAISGNLSPENLFEEPFLDDDLVFNRFAIKEVLRRNKECILIFGCDLSGSMHNDAIFILKLIFFNLVNHFSNSFSIVHAYFCAHQTSTKVIYLYWEKKSGSQSNFVTDLVNDEKLKKYADDIWRLMGGGSTSIASLLSDISGIIKLAKQKRNFQEVPTIYFAYGGDFEIPTEEITSFINFLTDLRADYNMIIATDIQPYNVLLSQGFINRMYDECKRNNLSISICYFQNGGNVIDTAQKCLEYLGFDGIHKIGG